MAIGLKGAHKAGVSDQFEGEDITFAQVEARQENVLCPTNNKFKALNLVTLHHYTQVISLMGTLLGETIRPRVGMTLAN